jgi:hypothetical protein
MSLYLRFEVTGVHAVICNCGQSVGTGSARPSVTVADADADELSSGQARELAAALLAAADEIDGGHADVRGTNWPNMRDRFREPKIRAS